MLNAENYIILPPQGDNIIRTRESKFKLNPNGLAHELFIRMKSNQNRIAQIDAETGVEETMGTVLERSIRIACHLKKLGVTSDDVVSPCTTNHLNSSTIFYAILFIGAKVASMDPFAPDEDKIRQMELVKPKYIFVIPDTADKLAVMVRDLELKTKIVVFGKSDTYTSFEEFLVPLLEEEQTFTPHLVTDLFKTLMVVFSSGTSGTPKAICISHYCILVMISKGVQAPIVLLSYSSMVWSATIMILFYSAASGHIRLCTSGFEAKKTWSYLKKYHVNVYMTIPHELIAMLKDGIQADIELPYLKIVISSGGYLSHKNILKARAVFPNAKVIISYGQTELKFGLSMDVSDSDVNLGNYIYKPTMCGQPVEGATYKIVDTETEEILGPNKPGELRVKTKTYMLGYYNEDSSHRFDKDGFLKTGDILYYDEDYCFFFVERLKEMLRYKMTAIAPVELEEILIEHPFVKIAIVIGIPTNEGDLATAIVVKDGDNVTAEELKSLVASKVDDRKQLKGGVWFLKEEEIPFTPSGKIRRRALKQYILSLKQQT